MQKIYSSIFLILFTIASLAQEKMVINGKILDQKNGHPISFAHIYIPELNLGTASNLQGEFKFVISAVDSLLVSAIGYAPQVISLTDSTKKNKLNLNLLLLPKTYELAEVKIRPYPTYSELKRGILEYEMTQEEINMAALRKAFGKNLAMLARQSGSLEHLEDRGGIRIGSPITAIYKLFSRHAKNEKKYRKILIADDIKKRVGERLNFEMITTLTGLKDKTEIAEFIEFCDFHDTFVLAASEIQLYNSVMAKFKEYTLRKPMS